MTDFDLSDLEDLDEDALRHRLDRGDFLAKDDLKLVKRLLKKYEKEREFLKACEKASISSALVAQRRSRNANILAATALVVSIVGLVWQICSSAS